MDRTKLKLNEFNRRRKRYGEDLCDVVSTALLDGGAAGDSLSTTTVASNVPCFYESLNQRTQVVVGGTAYLASHKLELERTTQTISIKPEDKIKVKARNGISELTFEQPVVIQQSFSPLITVVATLTQQGYHE